MMRASVQITLGLTALILVSGCRATTRVTEVPRVDLQLNGVGNRGYLMGTPPPAPQMRTTRKILQTHIELPTFFTSLAEAPPPAQAPGSFQPLRPIPTASAPAYLQEPQKPITVSLPKVKQEAKQAKIIHSKSPEPTLPMVREKSVPKAEPRPAELTPATLFDTYVVAQGDSLWSIAARPEVYGRATKWRQIFDANRDTLEAPDQLRAGMKLRIPRQPKNEQTIFSDDGITVMKK